MSKLNWFISLKPYNWKIAVLESILNFNTLTRVLFSSQFNSDAFLEWSKHTQKIASLFMFGGPFHTLCNMHIQSDFINYFTIWLL